MQEHINQEIDKAQRALELSIAFLKRLQDLNPSEFTSPMRKTVEGIADGLDEHIARGLPYNLTFFHTGFGDWRPTQRLSPELKEELEKYLAYHFREIWGKTWICGEATRLRELMRLEF